MDDSSKTMLSKQNRNVAHVSSQELWLNSQDLHSQVPPPKGEVDIDLHINQEVNCN